MIIMAGVIFLLSVDVKRDGGLTAMVLITDGCGAVLFIAMGSDGRSIDETLSGTCLSIRRSCVRAEIFSRISLSPLGQLDPPTRS